MWVPLLPDLSELRTRVWTVHVKEQTTRLFTAASLIMAKDNNKIGSVLI